MTIRTKGLLGLALAACAFLAPASTARADVILVFGQLGQGNTITAVNNGASPNATTTITASDALVLITAGENITPGTQAFFNLSATSTGTASMVGSDIRQEFSGMFTLTSMAGGAGTNFLSGNFVDAVFGSGTGLTLSASDATPGESVTFTSSVITTLGSPRAISLSFANVTPSASIVNNSLGGFSSSVSGDFSAFPSQVIPAPACLPLLLAGAPLLGLAGWRKWRKGA